MWRKKTFFDFTDENSYKIQSCRISKNRNKWFEPKSFWTKILFGKCEKKHLNLLKKKHLKWFWMKKFVAQNMRVMKFVAHKVVFRTISPLLRIMWQKLVSDFEDEVSHKVQSWVKNVSYNVGNSLRTRGGLQFVAHKVILFLSVRFCETCNKNPW